MLTIPHTLYTQIRTHGERTYPHECCGVLLGHAHQGRNEVVDAVEAGNTRTDSAHNRYHIAPVELIRIQRQARGRGLDIVGFYHSHPDHPAMWSSTDFAEAHWFGCSYVITRVAKGAADVTNSFLLTGTSEEDKKFLDEPIEIIVTHQEPQ
jgi:proteasome lid subunit RPN8/RPN11